MSKTKRGHEADVPDETGKCFVVTGANAGVGSEIARDPALAQRLWAVSIAMTGVDPGLPAA